MISSGVPVSNVEIGMDQHINVKVPKDLDDRLWSLKTPMALYQVHDKPRLTGGRYTLPGLEAEYLVLSKLLQNNRGEFTEAELNTIIEYQTYILEAVVNELNPEPKDAEQVVQPASPPAKTTSTWKKVLFCAFMGVDMLPMVMEGLVYADQGISFLPFAMSEPITLAVGIGINLLELLLYYSFMAPFLKKNLKFQDTKADSMDSYYLKQKKLIDRLNTSLDSIDQTSHLKAQPFQQFTSFALACNEDIQRKADNYVGYKEGVFSRIFRYVVSGISTLQSLGGAYFIGKSFLMVIAGGALLGHPAGWAVIAAIMLFTIASRLIYRSNGMFVMLNPKAQTAKEVDTELKSFEPRDDFNCALNLKQELEAGRRVRKAIKDKKRDALKVDVPNNPSLEQPSQDVNVLLSKLPIPSQKREVLMRTPVGKKIVVIEEHKNQYSAGSLKKAQTFFSRSKTDSQANEQRFRIAPS